MSNILQIVDMYVSLPTRWDGSLHLRCHHQQAYEEVYGGHVRGFVDVFQYGPMKTLSQNHDLPCTD